jgi:valyl-tRNA synthetase
LQIIEKYGTDALRFALSTGTSPGNDMKLAVNRLEASRNFANKIWNASRFVIRSIGTEPVELIDGNRLPTEDRWILSRLNRTIINATKLMEDFQFGEAQRVIYDFLWGEFCDWYIEIAKIRLKAGSATSPVPPLVHVLETSLRLLHPYMPFITEDLWQTLKRHTPDHSSRWESIMVADYPTGNELAIDVEAERTVASLIEIIHAIRNARAENKVESSRWIEANIYAGTLFSSLKPYTETIRVLAQIKPLEVLNARHTGASSDQHLVLVLRDSDVVIPLASMVDLETEKVRLKKEYHEARTNVDRLEARLGDPAFNSKAPPVVVQKERDRLNEGLDRLHRLEQQMKRFE